MKLIDKLENSIDALANELHVLRAENEKLRTQSTESLSVLEQNGENNSALSLDEAEKQEVLSRIDALLSTVQERLTQKNASSI